MSDSRMLRSQDFHFLVQNSANESKVLSRVIHLSDYITIVVVACSCVPDGPLSAGNHVISIINTADVAAPCSVL